MNSDTNALVNIALKIGEVLSEIREMKSEMQTLKDNQKQDIGPTFKNPYCVKLTSTIPIQTTAQLKTAKALPFKKRNWGKPTVYVEYDNKVLKATPEETKVIIEYLNIEAK